MAFLTRILSKGVLNGEVEVPQAGSLLHRYLICSALSNKTGAVECRRTSRDIIVTKKCLDTLELGRASFGDENFTYRLECEESDSTYKFLMPIAGAYGKNCMYGLKGNLVFTSMDQFYKVLRTHGLKRDEIRPDLIKVSGQLTAGTYILPGVSDGQALSGLLMALPLLKEKSTVMVEKKPQSELYVDMTIELMRRTGIEIETLKDQNGLARVYKIAGGQHYNIRSKARVEGDWTLAAYWLTGAAITGGCVTCKNMNMDSMQGDVRILNILQAFNVKLEIKDHTAPDTVENGENVFWSDVTARGGRLKGTNIDAGDIPDLVPAVVLLACAADGVSIIKNVSSIRMSEDRVNDILHVMSALGAEITEVPDGLLIAGSGSNGLKGGRVSTHRDYRIAMMIAMASNICADDIIVENSDSAERIYPGFYEELDRLKK